MVAIETTGRDSPKPTENREIRRSPTRISTTPAARRRFSIGTVIFFI